MTTKELIDRIKIFIAAAESSYYSHNSDYAKGRLEMAQDILEEVENETK